MSQGTVLVTGATGDTGGGTVGPPPAPRPHPRPPAARKDAPAEGLPERGAGAGFARFRRPGRHAPIAPGYPPRVIVGPLEDPASPRGKISPLSGPVEFTHKEIAQVLSCVLGKDVPYKQVSPETMLQTLPSGGQKPPAEHSA